MAEFNVENFNWEDNVTEVAGDETIQNTEEGTLEDVFAEEDVVEDEVIEEEEELNKLSPVYDFLREEGMIDESNLLKDGEELTDDVVRDVFDDFIKGAGEENLKNALEGLPPDLRSLNEYVLNGGDFQTYLSKLITAPALQSDLDMSDELVQEDVVRHALASQGLSRASIDSQVEFYKEKNTLEAISKDHYKILKNNQEQSLRDEQMRVRNENINYQKEIREFSQNLKQAIKNEDSFYGMKLGRLEKRTILDKLVKPSVNLNGAKVTPLVSEFYKAMREPKKAVFLMKLLDSDFNLTPIKEKAKTQKTKELQKKIQDTKIKVKSNNNNQSTPSWIDAFD